MFDRAVILLAEADETLREHLAGQLDADEAVVHLAVDSAQARAKAAVHRPTVLVLGALERPPAAVGVLRAIRCSCGRRGDPVADLPVVVLVDEGDELATLRAFESGADDVVPRTVSYSVLRARLRVLLGLSGRSRVRTVCRVRGIELDAAAREVRVHGEPVELSGKEFALLSALMAEPTRVFTRQELLRDVWGFHGVATTRTLDSHAHRLRRKLNAQGDRFVTNVWGVGLRLVDPLPDDTARAA